MRRLPRGRKYIVMLYEQHQAALNRRWCTMLCRRLSGSPLYERPWDRVASFHYPERLWMAFAVSIWLQIMYVAIVLNFAQWIDAASRGRASRTRFSDPAGISGNPNSMPPLYLALTLLVNEFGHLFADVLTMLREAAGDGFMQPFAYAAGFFQLLYVCSLWRGIFRRYKRRILAMRRGEYFFNRRSFRETSSSSYMGYQVAFVTVASINFFWVIVFFSLLAGVGWFAYKAYLASDGLSNDDGPATAVAVGYSETVAVDAAVGASSVPPPPPPMMPPASPSPMMPPASPMMPPPPPSPPRQRMRVGELRRFYEEQLPLPAFAGQLQWIAILLISIVLPFFFQLFMNRVVFFSSGNYRFGGLGNTWIRFRFWYALYEYVMLLPNLAIGLYMLQLRIVFSFLVNLYYFASLDVCTAPETVGYSWWDPGYTVYVALVRTDHRYNNPVSMVFFETLLEVLSQNRLKSGRAKLRREMIKRSVMGIVDLKALKGPRAPRRRRRRTRRSQPRPRASSSRRPRRQQAARRRGELLADGRHLRPRVGQDRDGRAEAEDRGDGTRLPKYKKTPEALRARNRWQLAKMLMNPSLQIYRWHRCIAYCTPEARDVPAEMAAATARAAVAAKERLRPSAVKASAVQTGAAVKADAVLTAVNAKQFTGKVKEAAKAAPAKIDARAAGGDRDGRGGKAAPARPPRPPNRRRRRRPTPPRRPGRRPSRAPSRSARRAEGCGSDG